VAEMDGIDYLETLDKFGVKPGLQRIKLLLDYLGNPEKELNIIHIGGTNGKGSTSALLTSIYRTAGYKVGTYNSPHIIEFNERIRINDQYISEQELTDLMGRIKPAVEQVKQELEQPSFFEVVTALALVYFAQEQVELAILEVGMGGRWDATNIGNSLLSVITNVSLDHTDYLGDTVAEIAREKAGIIKPGQAVVTGVEKEAAAAELAAKCETKRSRLINVRDRFNWQQTEVSLQGQRVKISSPAGEFNEIWLPLLGEHQIINLLLALAVIEELGVDYPVTGEEIKQGVAEVNWPGRLEVVSLQPPIILDGAHNRAAAAEIKKFLTQIEYQNLILVLGILADKDIKGISDCLSEQAERIIVTQNKSQRSAGAEKLAGEVKGKTKLVDELSAAVKAAQEMAEPDDLILISGSLYTVREAREILIKK